MAAVQTNCDQGETSLLVCYKHWELYSTVQWGERAAGADDSLESFSVSAGKPHTNTSINIFAWIQINHLLLFIWKMHVDVDRHFKSLL